MSSSYPPVVSVTVPLSPAGVPYLYSLHSTDASDPETQGERVQASLHDYVVSQKKTNFRK